jgi:arginyl-tRNA--protein-N-Asp/Glu arginylyltransferase
MTPAPASEGWGEVLEQLPAGPAEPCSYFPDRAHKLQCCRADRNVPPELVEAALAHGFRRCGQVHYRARCPGCNLCLAYRVRPAAFRPGRNLRRVEARNRDVVSRVGAPRCTRVKEKIYLRYQHSRHYLHPGLRPARPFSPPAVLAAMRDQMYTNPASTRELELHLDSRLIGFGIMDVAVAVASLVYFVFDPDFGRRSLGTLNILRAIAWAGDQQLDYVYLGYYLPNHPKMSYKGRFGPAEMLNQDTGAWQTAMPPLRGLT